ncbi:hypothetical protein J437_LFUL017176, partial [Ladona fulva]
LGEHRGFLVDAVLNNGDYVTATQFGLRANQSVPNRKTILQEQAQKDPHESNPNIPKMREYIAAVSAISSDFGKNCEANLVTDLHLQDYDWFCLQQTRRRMDCCNGVLAAVHSTGILWSSDEAHFYLSGTVNKLTFRYWTAENLRELHTPTYRSQKVTVWCFCVVIIGPYFFGEDEVTTIVNSNRYRDMLENFLRLDYLKLKCQPKDGYMKIN